MEAVRQYEIWWASLPSPAGRRPVMLLSRDRAYSYLNKYLAVEITSTVRNIAQEVPLGRGEGLKVKCVANCDNIRTIPRSVLTERIGRLSPTRYAELKRALGHTLGWDELIGVP
jgi:mRNA-degrading endonuclease toxin of MazEF toxin-antitoxin module